MSNKEIIYKTYLIYGNNLELRKQKIQNIFPENFKSENNPDYLEIKLSEKKKSIGIEEVKAVGQFLQTKPISHRVKIALISDANSLTIEAQNSLLKTLEEHTNNSIIILEDSYINFLLPTIISRCILEKVQNSNSNTQSVPDNFFEMNETEKLNYFETINKLDKEELIQLLNNSFSILKNDKYQNFKETNTKNINFILNFCENLEKYNLNTRLALENLALNLIPIMI
jgi:DNA polymerase III delta prime subunit